MTQTGLDPEETDDESCRRVGARLWLHLTDTPVSTFGKEEGVNLPPLSLTVELPSANAVLTTYGHTAQEVFRAAREALVPIWQDAVEVCEPVMVEQGAKHWKKGFAPTVGSFPTWPVAEGGYQWPEQPLQTFEELDEL